MPRKRKGERQDGRIQIQLDIGRDTEGRRLRKFFYGATRAEAERKKALYLEQIQGKTYSTDMMLSEWIEDYLKTYPLRSNPLYYSQAIVPYNRLKTALGESRLSSIREVDLQRFMNGLKGYSASTISKQMQVTKAVFAKARKNKLINDDPAEDIVAPKGTKGTHRALSRSEIELILKYYPQVYSGLWVMLMLFAGLRRGEMMALDWQDVHLDERTLTVKQTAVVYNNKMIVEPRAKTSAGIRIIPIGEPLYDALVSVPEARRSGFVCVTSKYMPLTETAVKRGIVQFIAIVNRGERNEPLNQRGRRNDLHPEDQPFTFRCHDLRHTFSTLLFDGNVDVKTAAYLMGHSDVTVTMRIYTHLSEERRASSSAAILDYFRGFKTQIK